MTRRPDATLADLALIEHGLADLRGLRLSVLAENEYDLMHPSYREAEALKRTRAELATTRAERDADRAEALDLAIELHHRQGRHDHGR